MGKEILSAENKQFIKDNYLVMTGNQMAKQFGVTKGVVNRYQKKNGYQTPKEVIKQSVSKFNRSITTSNAEIDKFIQDNYLLMPVKRIAKHIGKSHTFVCNRLKQLDLIIPIELIEQRKADSRIKEGNTPVNKGKTMSVEQYEKVKHTFFKKGHTPANTLSDGIIVTRFNHKKRNEPPYKWIRISLGNWEMLNRYIWKKHHGSIPNGMCVAFIDRNTLNCNISNLELITREENMIRNSLHNYPEDIVKAIQTRSLLTRTINKTIKENDNK